MTFFSKAFTTLRKRTKASMKSEPEEKIELQPMSSQENVADGEKIRPQSRAGFDRLPMEIRKKIFRIALSDPQLWGPVPISQTSKRALREPELMRVCKTFRAEVGPLYYGRNSFIFYLQPWEGAMAAVVKKILYMLTFTDVKSLLDRLLIIVHPRWAECDTLLPLLQLICESGPADWKGKARLTAYDSKLLIDRSRHPRNVSSQELLDYAVQLALRARFEGWYGKRLQMEYGDLLARMRPKGCDLHPTVRCRRLPEDTI